MPARTASALTATQSLACGIGGGAQLHAPSAADHKRYTMKRVEAVNYAIRGLPADRIRFHLCWGSWHGSHTTDLPMADIGGRVHPQIAWAKLDTLVKGAEPATSQLWG